MIEFPHQSPNPLRRKPPDPVQPRRYCRHMEVVVDEHSRTVKCRPCGQIIDAFDYLFRLAKEWGERAAWLKKYEAAKRKQAEEMKDAEFRRANDLHVTEPSGGKGRDVWRTAREALGREPVAIKRCGRHWYHVDPDGSTVSIDYLIAVKKGGR